MHGSELGAKGLTAAIAGVNTRSRVPAMTCTVEGSTRSTPAAFHQLSTAVHKRPWPYMGVQPLNVP